MDDTLKVDIRQTSIEEAKELVKKHGPWRCRMLAEKVETREEFTAAKAAGFVISRDISSAGPKFFTPKKYLPIASTVYACWRPFSEPEVDVRELEAIIKQEASICYRFASCCRPRFHMESLISFLWDYFR